VTRFLSPPGGPAASDMVEVKGRDGKGSVLDYVWRSLPRNGGRYVLLGCGRCGRLRRCLYGWELSALGRLERAGWRCGACAGLRYASEGRALVFPAFLSRLAGVEFGSQKWARPEPWYPHVFSNPVRAYELGLAQMAAGAMAEENPLLSA
jgi:hypothetical protein